MARQSKVYNLDKIAGLVATWKNRRTGAQISIYHAEQAGLDSDGGRWVSICENHGDLCNHDSLRLAKAHAAIPEWCTSCAKIIHGGKPEDADT